MRRIAAELGVALSSVSLWVRDLPTPPPTPRRRAPRPKKPSLPVAVGTHHCPRCDMTLPLSAFNRSGEGHQGWCRACFRAYFKERGQLHRDQCAAGKRRRIEAALAHVDQYLEARSCSDCGEADPNVLEFDHVGTKRDHVSWLVWKGPSIEMLQEEISQCEVVCVNCHRRRTARRGGSWRASRRVDVNGGDRLPHERRAIRFVREHLLESRCADCGTNELAVLDFDHIGPKTARVMKLACDGYSLRRIQAEIDQCEVRCANCHRRRTRDQFGHRMRSPKLPAPP